MSAKDVLLPCTKLKDFLGQGRGVKCNGVKKK